MFVLLQAAALGNGYVSATILQQKIGWEKERSMKALDHLVKEGLAWVDTQGEETLYYFPSLFSACVAAESLSATSDD